jgi:hypothetical protein
MAVRPQPAPALKKTRREGHPFEPAAAPATAAEPAAVAQAPAAATPQRRNAATAAAARRNGGDAAGSTAASGTDQLVKLSVRVPPVVNRHMKLYGAEHGLSFQEIAMTALKAYFQEQKRPLPDPDEAE